MLGVIALAGRAPYASSKAGVINLTRVLALVWAGTGVTANAICPAYVRTPLVDAQIAAQASENGISEASVVSDIMLKPMPKGVFISMDELAGICEFLLSPAARNITGQCIVVDGGWTVQ